MPIEYAIKQDKNLLKVARKLFGNCVSKACVATHYIEGYSNKQKTRIILKEREKYTSEYNGIDLDARTIILVINEKPILFMSSEWGGAEEFDFEKAIEF